MSEIPMRSDRAARDVVSYYDEHTNESTSPVRHNPLPGAANGVIYSDGSKWVRADSLPLACLTDGATAGEPLLAGGGAGDPAWGPLDVAHISPATTGKYIVTTGTAGNYVAQWSDGFLSITANKTLTALNTLNLSGTDGKNLALTGSLTVGADTTITGGGTLALATYTLTVPATGTALIAPALAAAGRVAYYADATSLTATSVFTYSPPTNGLYVQSTTTGAGAGRRSGTECVMIAQPGGDSAGQWYGGFYDARLNDNNNLTAAAGGLIGLGITWRNLGTGTVTKSIGVDINAGVNSGGGAVTTVVGLQVANQTLGGTNNCNILVGTTTAPSGNWSLYNPSAYTNHLAGSTLIGTVNDLNSARLQAVISDSATNTTPNVVNWRHTSSGTPAAGFGVCELYSAKSSTTDAQSQAEWISSWVVATHASRTARLVANVYDTAARECLRMEASGTAAMIGFLGANAVARAAHIANPTDLPSALTSIASILTALENYGLLATS